MLCCCTGMFSLKRNCPSLEWVRGTNDETWFSTYSLEVSIFAADNYSFAKIELNVKKGRRNETHLMKVYRGFRAPSCLVKMTILKWEVMTGTWVWQAP